MSRRVSLAGEVAIVARTGSGIDREIAVATPKAPEDEILMMNQSPALVVKHATSAFSASAAPERSGEAFSWDQV